MAHLTCRDCTKLGLANRLLGVSNLAVDGILALTGDVGAKNAFELRSPELIALIGEMNVGKFGENDLKAPTNLQIGAAVNPNVEGQVERLKEKIAAGVQFIQTQPIFSRAKFDQFLTEQKRLTRKKFDR